MESARMVRQIVDFQKTAFDNTYNAMVMLQEQTENVTRAYMNQAIWIPEEGRQTVDFWIEAYKKGRDDFKKAVDESYKNIASMVDETARGGKTAKSK